MFENAGLPVKGPRISPERYLNRCSSIKVKEGAIRFILLDGIGSITGRYRPHSLLLETLSACVADA
ncbi:MAG: hypothetical protein P0107_02205 [Nitrosomonas sp.]|nr:hypothetical protein [Nitrosomonas sp.]